MNTPALTKTIRLNGYTYTITIRGNAWTLSRGQSCNAIEIGTAESGRAAAKAAEAYLNNWLACGHR